ncbi:hypothetical protein [Caballeronia sp. HLA56]
MSLPSPPPALQKGHVTIVIFQGNELAILVGKVFQSCAARVRPAYNSQLPSCLDETLDIKEKPFLIVVSLPVTRADDHCA